jgi:hypothetical protein
MRLLETGNFGIGTSNPLAPLHIISKKAATLTGNGNLMLGGKAKYSLAMDPSYIQARYKNTASNLYLNYYGGAVYAGNYATSTYGLVGAGKYEGVYGYTYDSSGIGTYGYSSYWHGVYGYTGGGLGSDPQGSAGVYGYNSSTGYGVGGYCYNGSGVYAYSANYIGLWARGNASWYAGFFSGNVYTTGSYLPSDEKLKKDVKDVGNAMNIISQLHPKQYEYRQDGNYKLMNLPTGNRYGLLAQDVEKVLPGLVKATKFNTRDAQPMPAVDPKNPAAAKTIISNETIDFKAVNYTELIPVIIKAMQEQQEVINRQQQQIDELKQLVQRATAATDVKAAGISTNAYLVQNAPNPFSANTIIKCYVPSSVKQAQLVIYGMNGQLLKSYKLSTGLNNVNMIAGSLASGQYRYSLMTDGKTVDTKSMVITK